jgi:hypothetical protein
LHKVGSVTARLRSDHLSELFLEQLEIERLLDVIRCSNVRGTRLEIVGRRDHQHGDVDASSRQLAHHAGAVQDRHHQIEHHGIEASAIELAEPLFAVLRHAELVFVLESGDERVEDAGIIVDE